MENKDSGFMSNILNLILEKVVDEGCSRTSPVVQYLPPEELKRKLDLDLSHPCDDAKLLEICESVVHYSVKTGHPMYLNQLFSGLNIHGLAGAWLTEALNTSMFSYEVAPVFTLMELEVIRKMCQVIGYGEGEGVFAPGGSISNMYGINLARYDKFPRAKHQGMKSLPDVAIFSSDQSHFSVMKAASFLGFGTDNVVKVPSDERGKMDTASLEILIQESITQGMVPLIVIATMGTTVLGAYDPLEKIADLCERFGIWLHADASWGGGALLSRTHKHLLTGINRCNSVTWNPHKLMGVPLQCSAFLTKHTGLLRECNSSGAAYLYQQDKCYDVSYDLGDMSVQCSRKADACKVWMMWKSMGDEGMERHINHIFSCARYFTEKIKEKENFRLVINDPSCTNVCFWYIPKSMMGKEENDAWWERLGKVAPMLKEGMLKTGTMMITYTPLGNNPNFLRLVICNHKVTKTDMDTVINNIQTLGQHITIE